MSTVSVKSGQKTVAAAGTAEALGSGLARSLVVKALTSNTGSGWVGNDGADDVSSTTGYELAPGDSVSYGDLPEGGVDQVDLAKVFVDVTTNGNGFSFTYVE